ncbi:MAG: ATP-dependent transcriptional regulator, MalT-like, LuxR family [Micrococcaceae bacterium]|nr:ATP-dependent transcriptional regulator, MalT-like, LuxR family [Micrococcaceae bacterium]
MVGSLIETKFTAPRLRRDAVSRPSTLERLERGGDVRLTLVSAPAGFGKTTLLAQWLSVTRNGDRRVAWLSLDEYDREPASFLTYLVAALRPVMPNGGTSEMELAAAEPTRMEPLLTAVLNELISISGEVWLVLDDFHLVDGPDVGAAMGFLIEHLPPNVHVIISTRADPTFPLSRWRARGELLELRAADLRFSRDEASAYLAGACPEVTPEDVAALTDRTEGWIAALQLAVLSLQGRDDVHEIINRFTGNDRFVVDYLVDEVLARQPAEVRDFLLRTSILTRMSGPLCDAVMAGAGSRGMLAGLERANLFIVALDDQREWYRYHHLFADVLRARLLSERPDEAERLHERASRWYEQQGALHDAISHALAGSQPDRAARLMELAAPAIRRVRQDKILLDWLQQLPDDTIRRSPVLRVFHGYSLMLAGDFKGAERHFDDVERLLGSVAEGESTPWAQSEELITLPATIAVYRASLAQAQGDVPRTAEHARHALHLARPDDHQSRAGGSGFLGLAAWAGGDVTGALKAFTATVASLHAGGNLIDELTSTVVLADLWLAAGKPSRARQLYDDALRTAEQHGGAVVQATAELHVGLGELAVEAGDLAAARDQLEASSNSQGPAGMPESRYRWYIADAALFRAEGDLTKALHLLGRAESLFHPGFFPDVRPLGAMRARIWIVQGDLTAARAWARERGLSPEDGMEYLHEFDHLTLARLLLAADAPSLALDLLNRLHVAAEAAQRDGSLLEIRVLQALAHQVQGEKAQAADVLASALASAPEPDASVRLFLNEGAPMTGLLRRAAQDEGVHPHVLRLLRLAAGNTETGGTASRQPPAPVLSERELQVLRLLDSELSGPEIARRLYVSHNTLRSHTKHIFTKLDVSSRRAAVLRARERGLI